MIQSQKDQTPGPQADHPSIFPSSSFIHTQSPGRKAEQRAALCHGKGQQVGNHCLAVGPGTTSSPSLVQSPDPESRLFWMRLTKVPTPPHESKSPGKPLQNANTQTSCRDSFLIGLSINTFLKFSPGDHCGERGQKEAPWLDDPKTGWLLTMTECLRKPVNPREAPGLREMKGWEWLKKGPKPHQTLGVGLLNPNFTRPAVWRRPGLHRGPAGRPFIWRKISSRCLPTSFADPGNWSFSF